MDAARLDAFHHCALPRSVGSLITARRAQALGIDVDRSVTLTLPAGMNVDDIYSLVADADADAEDVPVTGPADARAEGGDRTRQGFATPSRALDCGRGRRPRAR